MCFTVGTVGNELHKCRFPCLDLSFLLLQLRMDFFGGPDTQKMAITPTVQQIWRVFRQNPSHQRKPILSSVAFTVGQFHESTKVAYFLCARRELLGKHILSSMKCTAYYGIHKIEITHD